MPTITRDGVFDLRRYIPHDSLAAANQFLCTELNCRRANKLLSRRNWPERVQESYDSKSVFLTQHHLQLYLFDVIYARLSRNMRDGDFRSFPTGHLAVDRPLAEYAYSVESKPR
jgi:hypothetical protein